MKGIVSHGVSLALGVALGGWYFGAGQPQQLAVTTQEAAPAAPMNAQPQAPQSALAQAHPAPITSQAPAPKAAAEQEATPLSPQQLEEIAALEKRIGNLPSYDSHWQALSHARRHDDKAVKAEQAIWDGIAQAQQMINADLEDVLCDSDRLCVAKVVVDDIGFAGVVTERMRQSLKEAGLGLGFIVTEFDSPEGERPRLKLSFSQKSPLANLQPVAGVSQDADQG
ncbi:hypothetical protein [Gallaecimonas sp. GXIMD4217]|uniref:hypothetical protein n=1 Tax=Gallaecimonas sp. GXIMD4217 TaxID=3131927 RepID=UPI00311ABF53